MFKVFEILSAIVILWWLGYIFIAGDPNVRIERTCDPVAGVFGRLAGTAADLAKYDEAESVREFFQERAYDCRYAVWNQFYGDDWRRNAHDQPVNVAPAVAPKGAPVPGAPNVPRVGIDGLPLPELPGFPASAPPVAPSAGSDGAAVAVPKVEPLPPGVVPPPVRVEPVQRAPREVAPPTAPSSRKGDALEDIKLPEKRAPGTPSGR